MKNKWKKIILGAVLLMVFVSYTQYQRTAEPAWKVNSENFQVVDSWDELLKMEELKYQELKFINHFKLLKDSNISIPLQNEHRELRIEKTWDYGHQMYLLYSVDLLERDKNENEIPQLYVDGVKLSTKTGEEFETPAETYNGEIASAGYAYKHRLYRSIMVRSNFETIETENDWEKIMSSDRLELKKVSMSSKKGTIDLKPIPFKITPMKMDSFPKAIASSPINRSISLYNGHVININTLEFYQIGSRLILERNIDPNLIAFGGEVQSNNGGYPTEFQISEDNKGNKYLDAYAFMEELINTEEPNKGELKITHSVHRTNNSDDFLVTNEDIVKFTNNPNNDIHKEELIFDKGGIKAIYKGLSTDSESKQSGIKFSIGSKIRSLDYLVYPRPSYHFKDTDLDVNSMSNLVSIQNSEGKKLEDFDIQNIYDGEEQSFLIYFYNGIPKENLTITLSNLTQITPLKREVKIPLKLPLN